MTDTERRFTPGKVERRGTNDTPLIGGYAVVFGALSRNLGGFVERVDPKALSRMAGRNWPGVIARYNHDDNALLGTTAAGTLRLDLDDHGTSYEVYPPRARGDIVELVERGDVRYSSFAFRVIEDEWTKSDQGYPLRTLHSVELIDVAPVVSPAYLDTSAGLRSLARAFDASYEEIRGMAKNDELRSLFSSSGPRTDKRQEADNPAVLAAKRRAQLLDAVEQQ